MAKQRQISDKFWNDRYVAEELTDPEEKLLFIYLLTNTLINITGIYEIPMKQISFDTNITIDKIKTIIKKLSDAGKVHYEAGYIILTNYHKYASYNTDNVRSYVINYLKNLPKSIIEKHSPTIESIIALASQYAESNQGQGKGRARATKTENQGQGKGLKQDNPTPGQGQPYTNTSNDTSNDTSIPSSPLPPQGGRPAEIERWVRDPRTKEIVENPLWEGKEGKGNNQSSGKGKEGKEGKEGKLDVNHPDAIMRWSTRIAMKNSEVDKLEDEFGKIVAWDAIDKADDWAEEKGIEIKDSYKFVRGFAAKEVANG